jgi:hypothetical protein
MLGKSRIIPTNLFLLAAAQVQSPSEANQVTEEVTKLTHQIEFDQQSSHSMSAKEDKPNVIRHNHCKAISQQHCKQHSSGKDESSAKGHRIWLEIRGI